jgi:hypothetical protein
LGKNVEMILISLCTSLLVSLFTFILGLKSGKNQADRAMLQRIYREVFSQFDQLKRFIEDNRPKRWSHYEKIQIDLSSYQYIPPIAKLERTGELLHIKPSIAQKAVKLEEELVNYGADLFDSIRNIHNVLISDRSLYKEQGQFKEYQGQSNTDHFETLNPTECKSYTYCDYRDFYDKEEITRAFSRLTCDKSCAIEFRLQTDRVCITYKVYPEGLTVSPEEFIKNIYSKFNAEIKDFSRLASAKSDNLKQIEKLNKKIAKRVRDPYSFWETLGGAFWDCIRG